MTVKQIICETMRLIGRTAIADSLESSNPTDEAVRIKRAMVTYLNAVLDELARGYFPPNAVEILWSGSGYYYYEDFEEVPIKIKRVTDGKNPVNWHAYGEYLKADSNKITVYYEYLPYNLNENSQFYYPVIEVSARLVEYGMAAEYFLVAGDGAAYNVWENKYRAEIEMLLSRGSSGGTIPPRRWI